MGERSCNFRNSMYSGEYGSTESAAFKSTAIEKAKGMRGDVLGRDLGIASKSRQSFGIILHCTLP